MLGLFAWVFAWIQGRVLEAGQSIIQCLFHDDIRNPFNHVVNELETVLFDVPSLAKDAAQNLRGCREEGELILQVLDDVLNIDKLESGEPHNLRPTSVADVCSTALRVSPLIATSRTVRCELVWGPGCECFYHADGTRLSQVLLSLLSNAVKYVGDDGRVKLRLDVTQQRLEGYMLTFSVEDVGPGVREADRESMFENVRKFSRNSGDGLGLHLTGIIVQRTGGAVVVTSPAPGSGHGSVFSFTVLMKGAKPQPPAAPGR